MAHPRKRKRILQAMYRTCALFVIAIGVSSALGLSAHGQVDEDFSDGDFTSNPVWTGNTDLFTIVPDGPDFALQSDGNAASDTLQLRTASGITHGSWSFRFAYRNGQLTNFNQVRYFLTSDIEDLEGEVDGYHVQLGTNNRNVRLYRSDPAASGDRVLLGESASQIIPETEDTLTVSVSRDLDNNWFVSLDGTLLFSTSESGSGAQNAAYTGLWIKHSATRAADYFLDDVLITDVLPPDTFPPLVNSESFDDSVPGFLIDFSEPMAASSLQIGGAFSISTIGSPDSVSPADIQGRPAGTGALLTLASPPASGDYTISITSVTDLAGNAIADTSVTVTVVADETPPTVTSLAVTSTTSLTVSYSESVDVSSACNTSNYTVDGGVGAPDGTSCGTPPLSVVSLDFQNALEPGAYNLSIANVTDLSGNVLTDTTLSFSIEAMGDAASPGDIVVNEIYYDPPETDLEFIELYNKSQKSFDLSDFLFSDNRSQYETVSEAPYVLPPDSYAVLVRDATVFTAAFPGITFIEPPVWPALNNTGDAAILQYNGIVIDSVAFSTTWGGNNVSIERIDPDGPSNAFSNWGSSIDPAGATPGEQNSIYFPDTGAPNVRFSEELPSNIVAVYLTEPVQSSNFSPGNFSANGTAPSAVESADDGLTALLTFTNTLNADFLTILSLTDLTGNTSTDLQVEIARLPVAGDISINEIMFDPRANDDDGLSNQPEYFELVNNTQRLLSLSGMFWTDFPNEDGEADTMHFALEPSGISAGNYAVVFAQSESLSRDEIYSNSLLVDAFPRGFASLGVTLLHYRASSLSLLNDGDRIRLHTADGAVVDEVDYDPDWHHPNLKDSKGIALERIDPLGPSNSRQNWNSTVAVEGGSPGEQNTIFLSPESVIEDSGVVISPSPFSPDRDGVDDIAAITFNVASVPSLIRVRVFDASGRLVREIEDAGITANTGSVFWDGFDGAGRELPVGIYVVLFEAIDSTNGNTEVFKEPVVLARQLD